MKRQLIAAAAAALLATTAWAQSGNGTEDNGPGYGPGYYGMGPGMMYGYGPGGGGGYGPGYYGMGPGMMWGYGGGPGYGGPGYGMGPGMMYGYGGGYGPGYGRGPGWHWRYGPGAGYGQNLSQEQQNKLGQIQQEFAQKRWDLAAKVQQDRYNLDQLYQSNASKAELDKAYQALASDRKQMFDLALQARQRMDEVLNQKGQSSSGGQ